MLKYILCCEMRCKLLWLLALLKIATGFYLPGLAPTKFCTEEDVKKYGMDCQVDVFLFNVHFLDSLLRLKCTYT